MELKVDKSDVLGESNLIKTNDMKININSLNQNCISAKYFKKIDINKDGNCFYRCLAYYFEKNQNKHKYYRKQIHRYIKNI